MLSRVAPTTLRTLRVAPRVSPIAARFYAEQSGMNKKEKAHEDQYAREKEREELKKIKETIKKKEEELATLKKQQEAKENGA